MKKIKKIIMRKNPQCGKREKIINNYGKIKSKNKEKLKNS